MKKKYLIVSLLIMFGSAAPVAAESREGEATEKAVIAVVQTGRENAAGEDFIVIHNASSAEVDVTGWKLQYRAAAATGASGWATKRIFACAASDAAEDCRVTMAAGANLVASTYALHGISIQPLASGFSGEGGQLRLVRPTAIADEVVDRLGYGTAADAEGEQPAVAPPVGKVLIRKRDDVNKPIDTNVNALDFSVACYAPTTDAYPQLSECQEKEEEATSDDETIVTPTVPDAPTTYLPVAITELLPDPASPGLDSTDEFIELYNPHDQAVGLTGYVVEAGSDFKSRYTIGDITIPAGGYLALFSVDSHVNLTNSGTAVRIVDPKGVQLDLVESYGQAKTGQAWAKEGQQWNWTTTPSPGAANILTAPALPATTASTPKKSTGAAVKKASTSKAAKAAAAPKASTKTSKTTASATPNLPQNSQTDNQLQYFLLGAVGLGVLGYAGYEYRRDITRWVQKAWQSIARSNPESPPQESRLADVTPQKG